MNEVNNIPEGWVETTLGEISLKKQYGYTESASLEEIGPKFLRITDIQNDFIDWNKVPYCSINDSEFEKYRLQIGDIVIARTGNSTGATATVKDNVSAVFASYLIRFQLNEEKANYKYVDFLLRSKNWFDFVNSIKSGSAQGGANANDFARYPIKLPKLDEQKSIAAILTSFDDKIELLQAQNKTLEELAQTIFKEWFGKYKVGDELPDGWRVEELDGLLELVIDYRGKTPLKLGMDWSENGIPALSAKSIKNGKIVRRDAMNFGSEELYSIWMKDELKKGDILLTSEAPLGEMYYLNDDTRYILSQRLFALRVNQQITSEYLYHYLNSTNGQTLLQARASGSTVEGIRQSELRKIEVIVPDKNILEKASIIFKNVFDKTFANEQQIQTLTKTRDALLPKLMSGEIRVKKQFFENFE